MPYPPVDSDCIVVARATYHKNGRSQTVMVPVRDSKPSHGELTDYRVLQNGESIIVMEHALFGNIHSGVWVPWTRRLTNVNGNLIKTRLLRPPTPSTQRA